MLSCNSCPDGLSGVQPNEEQASQPIDVGDPMGWGERTYRLLKSDMSLFGQCMFALWLSNLREALGASLWGRVCLSIGVFYSTLLSLMETIFNH
jgi:hypothetical protein